MTPFRLNESCLLWTFGDTLSEQNVRTVLSVFQGLENAPELQALGITDIVPSYTSLAVHFQGSENRADDIRQAVEKIISTATPTDNASGALHKLPTVYDGEDLEPSAAHCGLSVKEFIERHSTPIYPVAMIGFQPHFPYLFGLDPALAVPRLEKPRTNVPAGSVAIGGAQTGVYPSESPGGWNLIGRTDPFLLISIRPGDRVQFEIKV
jgi:inhibitor of KinA